MVVVCDKIIDDVLALKKAVNEWGDPPEGKGPALVLASTVRTWSKQMSLWVDYKRGRLKNLAAQPGRSWHQAGRAIDIDPWSLRMHEDTEGLKKGLVEKRVFVTDEEKELGMKFKAQLDDFRRLAVDNGFDLIVKQHPWNMAYDRSEVGGTVVDAAVEFYLSFTLTGVDATGCNPFRVRRRFGTGGSTRGAGRTGR